MTNRWAVSVMVVRVPRPSIETRSHAVFCLDAVSEAEAEGLAMRVARKFFPSSDGWGCASLALILTDQVLTEFDEVKPVEITDAPIEAQS